MSVPRLLMLILLGLGSSVAAAWPAEIHDAVAAGDRARVDALLRADPAQVSAAADNRDADLPLHVAARAGSIEIAGLLLDAGADVDGLDVDESTPLHAAALTGQAGMVRFLLGRGADVNRRDRNGGCALSFAVLGRDTSIVRSVLEAGADLNYRSRRGGTLLHIACLRGMWDLVALALAHDPDVNARDLTGATPLHYVAAVDDSGHVARVIALGADLAAGDTSGNTPLHVALYRGGGGAARALLAAGAPPDAPDRDGWSPLNIAVRDRDLPMVRRLLAHGADPARPDPSPWPLSRIAVEVGDAGLLALLLERGMKIAPPDSATGSSALHMAVLGGRADVVRVLLDHGADTAARDGTGATPLDLAVRYGHQDVAGLLAGHGAPGAAWTAEARGGPDARRRPARGEASIWYLGHSGWAVKTRNHFLVFDYGLSGPAPDQPALVNGHIDPAELRGQRVTVFVSHEHGDHFDPAVFRWREQLPGIHYVLGFQPDSAPPHVRVAPRESRTVDGMRVTAIHSNDSGVGYVVEVDGLVLFHAGDHANSRRDLGGDYPPEIEFIKAQGLEPDLAFLPITGCNFRDPVAVEIGVEYTLRTLGPDLFLPMHGGFFNCRYGGAREACRSRFPDIRTADVRNRGDHLDYRKTRSG